MPVIKAFDLAYGRIRSPDLDKQEEFLTDFGMVRDTDLSTLIAGKRPRSAILRSITT